MSGTIRKALARRIQELMCDYGWDFDSALEQAVKELKKKHKNRDKIKDEHVHTLKCELA